MGYMNMDSITSQHFQKNDYMFEQFIPRYDEIWLFGTGLYASAFDQYLNHFGVEAKGFVVSNLTDKCTDPAKPVISIEDFKSHYFNGNVKCALLLAVDEKHYNEIIPALEFIGFSYGERDLLILPEETKLCATHRFAPIDDCILSFHIIEHCNLSCYSCNVASPCAKEVFYDFDSFKKDIRKLHDLLGGINVKEVVFTGGEPLLHPKLVDFLIEARMVFQNAKVDFITNGVLLSKQSDDFWKLLGEHRLGLQWTLYPIKYDFTVNDLQKKAEQYKFDFIHYGDQIDDDKTSWRLPFDMRGKQSPYDFLFCKFHRCGNRSISVTNGLIVSCCFARKTKNLKLVFDDTPTLQSDDYLILDNVKNSEEVEKFLTKRIPLCDYCAIREFKSLGKWLPSKKDKREWFVDNDED